MGVDLWLLALLFSPTFDNNRKSSLEHGGLNLLLDSAQDDGADEIEMEKIAKFVALKNAFWKDPSSPLPAKPESEFFSYQYMEFFEDGQLELYNL